MSRDVTESVVMGFIHDSLQYHNIKLEAMSLFLDIAARKHVVHITVVVPKQNILWDTTWDIIGFWDNDNTIKYQVLDIPYRIHRSIRSYLNPLWG